MVWPDIGPADASMTLGITTSILYYEDRHSQPCLSATPDSR